MNPIVTEQDAPVRLADKNALGAGRIGVYTAFGAAIGVIPLPWIPDAMAKRVRGALVQDVAGRHGLSITPEARAVLADPDGSSTGSKKWLSQAVKFATRKVLVRFAPIGFLPPLRAASQTFALGHLLHRYFATARKERTLRIDVEEARKLRAAIDAAVLATLRIELEYESGKRSIATEDLRDEATRIFDGVIIAAAGLPDWLVRRLDAAFDECFHRA